MKIVSYNCNKGFFVNLHYFFYTQASLFFHLHFHFVSLMTFLMLFFCFSFRNTLIPFTSLFWNLFFITLIIFSWKFLYKKKTLTKTLLEVIEMLQVNFIMIYIIHKISVLLKIMRTLNCFLSLFRIDLFGAAHGRRGIGGDAKRPPLPKICHTYPTMMKLGTLIPYPKRIQKIYKSRYALLKFCWHQNFSPEIRKFCYFKK